MFASAMCAGALSVALGTDPLIVLQLRYPASRMTVTTASGQTVYYLLPADAPPQLRRAYKVLEIAEREVLVSEALQLLELEYVNNERRLEALRTGVMAQYLAHMRYPGGLQGPTYSARALLSPPEPAIRWAVTRNITQTSTAGRALRALDLLTSAQFELQQTLLDLAHPERRNLLPPGGPAVPGVPPGLRGGPVVPADPRVGPGGLGGAGRPVGVQPVHPKPVVQVAAGPEEARQAERAVAAELKQAGAELKQAGARDRAAQRKDAEAGRQYLTAPPEERAAAKRAWDQAREEWKQAREGWQAAHRRWTEVHNRLNDLQARHTAGPTPPTAVGVYPISGLASAPVGRRP